jgi:hypothetical protein
MIDSHEIVGHAQQDVRQQDAQPQSFRFSRERLFQDSPGAGNVAVGHGQPRIKGRINRRAVWFVVTWPSTA